MRPKSLSVAEIEFIAFRLAERFMKFMEGVNKLIEGPTPPENPDCKWCDYRHHGEKYAHLFKK